MDLVSARSIRIPLPTIYEIIYDDPGFVRRGGQAQDIVGRRRINVRVAGGRSRGLRRPRGVGRESELRIDIGRSYRVYNALVTGQQACPGTSTAECLHFSDSSFEKSHAPQPRPSAASRG